MISNIEKIIEIQPKKLLQLIEFSKVEGCKINIQKLLIFLYIKNRIFWGKYLIYNSIKNNKIFKDEFKQGGGNYKTLMKEIEEDTNKCKGILCHDLKNQYC